jgi:adenylate cyclase
MAIDPRYAGAYVGLANAHFWQYETSRARNQPDAALLARAIDYVRRAIELERDLAEAHATLAFLLMSARRAPEALVAARRAVAIEPGYWGNQFRLAHAAFSVRAVAALARAMDLYPDFPFVHSKRRWSTSHVGTRIRRSWSCAKAPSSRIGRRI